MTTALPRVVVAAPASGHGKTTVATGLMAALRRAGHRVSGHKVGPDYIDPGYHALATGRPGRNLDAHLVGTDLLGPLLRHGAAGADLAIIEGVMGLYDGMLGTDGFASTAHVARELAAPVVLVVDIAHASRSVAAVVHGMASFDRGVRIAGVILNKSGSSRHTAEVVDALAVTGIPVLGVLHRDDGIAAPSRHLGLVPADERPEAAAALDRLATRIADHVDLARVVEIARSAGPLDTAAWTPPTTPTGTGRPVVAIAGGRAFTFRYTETEELLRAAGCDPVVFDPLRDSALPEGTRGVYLGGGFPEVHAPDLAANLPLLEHIRHSVAAGLPTVAECAGLLYLSRTVDGTDMVGALDTDAAMSPRLTLGYRTAIAPHDTVLGPAGTRVTGHEFHRTVAPASGTPAWLMLPSGPDSRPRPDGYASVIGSTGDGRAIHASYLHTHWAGYPALAQRFADAARAANPVPAPAPRDTVRTPPTPVPDLHHHGDREADTGMLDLAVNVIADRPGWLDDALAASLGHLARYPDATDARAALAARHGRDPAEVLPTAGAAEAFTLLARARQWRRPVVVHPQFTEPEAALRAAGLAVARVTTQAATGFALDPGAVPADADLVVVGNPTNPTGVLHPADTLRALLAPGRVVVVDEAFMDVVADERASLADDPAPGLVVVRSLTKTWGLPGIRAGYLLADPGFVGECAAQQPPWSVSTPATAAMIACSDARALAETRTLVGRIASDRAYLVDALATIGVACAATDHAPFVLARVRPGTRDALRRHGVAVRRCDTFPGLDDSWIRIAVRDRATTDRLIAALSALPDIGHVA